DGSAAPARATSRRPAAASPAAARPCDGPARGADGRGAGGGRRTRLPGSPHPGRLLARSHQGTGAPAAPWSPVRWPRPPAPHVRGPRGARSRSCRPHPGTGVAWSGLPSQRDRERAENPRALHPITVHSLVMGRPTSLCLRLAAMLAAASLAGSTAVDASTAESPPARFGDGLCAITQGTCGAPPMIAVLSAFPAELAPLIERATVRETVRVGDRVLRVGTLGDVPVVLGLLGIGLVNAANTTKLVLDRFDVDALIVSGVAGSPQRIGDVTAPDTWVEDDGASHPVDPTLLAIAREVAADPGV